MNKEDVKAQTRDEDINAKILQAIMDSTPALISAKDLKGTAMMTNPGFAVLETPHPKYLLGKNVDVLFPFENKAPHLNYDLAVQQIEKPLESEETACHKDGSVHTYFTVKFPLYNKLKEIFGTCAISVDITDNKNAAEEQGKIKTKKEIDDLYDHAPCGYHSLDKNGTFTRMNKTELSWLGYSSDEIIGKKKVTHLLTPEGIDLFEKKPQALRPVAGSKILSSI